MSLDEVVWTGLPDGTKSYVAGALATKDCKPVRSVSDYIAKTQAATPAKDYIAALYDNWGCKNLTTEEFLNQVVQAQGKWPSLEKIHDLGPDENPLYFGPGCVGIIGTIGVLRKEPAQTRDAELSRLALAAEALLASLPKEVAVTGERKPTPVEDSAMALAAAVIKLGDALNDPSADLEGAVSSLQRELDLSEGLCLTRG